MRTPYGQHVAAFLARTRGRILAWTGRRLAPVLESVAERFPDAALVHAALGRALLRQMLLDRALAEYRRASELKPDSATYHYRIANILSRRQAWWQVREELVLAVALQPKRGIWHFRLGRANQALNRFEEAVESYRMALLLRPTSSLWHYHLGVALERCSRSDEAQAAYARAMELSSARECHRLGLGLLHQQEGAWGAAATAYAAQLEQHPCDAQLHYRLAFAYDRSYRWHEAASFYTRALELEPERGEWHFRLGFVHERQGAWSAAARSYAAAVNSSRSGSLDHDDACYRLGWVLYQAQRLAEAIAAFAAMRQASLPEARNRLWHGMLGHEPASAGSHYLLGCERERAGDLPAAAAEYRAAAVRAETLEPKYYYRLGVVLGQQGSLAEACEAFSRTRILRAASGVSEASSSQSGSVRRATTYTELYEDLPLVENLVFYECFFGASMSCNPAAVFRELRGREECKGWTHVWCLDQRDKAPREYRNLPDVCFVPRGSDAYLRCLASAKFLINNVTFPGYFVRKPGQIYLNTWHGTPIKHLGKDIREGILSHANVTRNFLQATHLISPNPHTTRILLERYDVAGIIPGVVAETGYPRIDATLNATAESRRLLRERLRIREGQRIVLYAPTWRGTHGGDIRVDLERLQADIHRLLSPGFAFLFRGHHLAEARLTASTLSGCAVPQDIDTNELLSLVDVLITDYSSIVFDFLVTGRPVIYYAYDLEQYVRDRGLYFPLSELPGEVCETVGAVAEAIERALRGDRLPSQAAYHEARQKYCPLEDGKASRRVADLFLHDKRDGFEVLPRDSRKSLLFYVGPLIPNGILASWKNLVSALSPERYLVTLVLEPALVRAFPERTREFESLPPHVHLLGRGGVLNSTVEERWLMRRFHEQNHLACDEMMQRYRHLFAREYRRGFGDAHFDCLINFEGYNQVWVATLAGSSHGGPRRAIFLHNDMLNEWRTRFPYLEGVFRLYNCYDVLCSVSRLTRDLNRANLMEQFLLEPGKFEYCENLQNPEQVLDLARVPIEEAGHKALLGTAGPKFLTLGRLSPEKDHAKLIRAFAALHREQPTARLFILGDGPLRGFLRDLIDAQGLDEHVFLLGHKPNPFPYVVRADAFVLSSNYEGQPMVLFEAMILEKPIIATNIVGSRSVLEGRAGLLVENSESGLLDGMRQFIRGEIASGGFDNDAYRAKALAQFVSNVLGEVRDRAAS